MLEQVHGSVVLTIALVLFPAIIRLWRGRALARNTADPALPERLFAHQRRNGAVFGFSFALLAIGWPDWMAWTIPSLVLARAAAAYPLRRALYHETWSLPAYLWFFTRLIVAVFGFWLLLVWTPSLVDRAGSFDWLAAAGLAVVLVAWNVRHADVLRGCLNAQPIENEQLKTRFTALASVARLSRPPRLERVDLRGGAVANALALPSLGAPGVLFTQTLLSLLDEDETVGICAHEIAHLEHYNSPRLTRISRMNYVLIAGAVTMPWIARASGMTSTLSLWMLWGFTLFLTMMWRARDRQKHETESDLRAVALTGNAEALARGLEKTYTFNRVPRRWDAQFERQATHPSLARRIRAIREAAGAAPVALTAPAAFAGTDGQTSVAFDAQRLEWHEGEAAIHSLSYAHLAEVRVQAKATGGTHLLVVERGGRRWTMALNEADVAPVQRVLDTIDGHLSAAPAASHVWPRASRALVSAAALAAFLVTQFGVVLVALLALAQPGFAMLVAAGLASLTGAAVALRDVALLYSDERLLFAVMLAALGVTLLAVAWRSRRDEVPRHAKAVVWSLGAMAALSLASIVVAGPNPVRIHQAARAFPGAAVLIVAFGGVLRCSTSRRVRVASIPVLATGILAAIAGSTMFLEYVGRDPLLLPSGWVEWKTLPARDAGEITVPFLASDVQLSPDGRRVAMKQGDDDDSGDDEVSVFYVGEVGAAVSTIEAVDLVFVDGDRAIVTEPHNRGVTVRELAIGTKTTLWEQHVEDISGSHLSFTHDSGEWKLLGWNRAHDFVRAQGHLGSAFVDVTRWANARTPDGWIDAATASGSHALLVETHYDDLDPLRGVFWQVRSLMSAPTESRLWSLDSASRASLGVSHLDVRCIESASEDDRLVCTVFDGEGTRIVGVDPATGRLAALAALPGRFAAYGRGAGGWLEGWSGSSPAVLRLDTREAIRPPRRQGERIGRMAANGRLIATVAYERASSTIRVYDLQ